MSEINTADHDRSVRSRLDNQAATCNAIRVVERMSESSEDTTTCVAFGDCFLSESQQLRIVVTELPEVLTEPRN